MTTSARVLVVDDEQINRLLIEAILEPAGHTIIHAEDGEQALALIAEGGIDLVLLDVLMPGIDGVEVCRRIRHDVAHALIPIIVISALSDAESRTRGKEAGADEFLSKPIHDAELIARTRNLLRLRESYRLGEALRLRAEAEANRWKFTSSVATAVAGSISYERFSVALLERLRHELDVERIAYAEWVPGGYRLRAAVPDLDRLPAARVATTASFPTAIAALDIVAGGPWDALRAFVGNGPAVGLPISERGAPIGMVLAARSRAFGDLELETLSAVAPHVSNGIINVRSHVTAVEAVRLQERTEVALQLSEERQRLLFEGSPLPIWVFDLNTARIEGVNEALVRLSGYSRAELRTMATGALIERSATDVTEPLNRNGAVRLRCKNGVSLELEVTSHTMLFDDQQVGVTIGMDMTQARRSEEQLRQVQKMDAIGMLAGGVAHDFNNILAAILANAELALETVGEQSQIAVELSEIMGAARLGADVTRQLLAFSRKQRRAIHVISLDSCVENIERLVARLVGSHIQIVSDRASAQSIHADRSQIEQLVMNIIVNARDAMPDGGRLTISTRDVVIEAALASELGLAPGPFVTLTISDTGCGIEPALIDRVFEPFFTTKEVGKGTGLGLATAFGIVKESSGAIQVESEVGRGTTFRVFLPSVDAVPEHVLDPKSAPTAQHVARSAETILLVEDNDSLRTAIRRQLVGWGYQLLEARDGASALEVLEQRTQPVDLVITDLMMPGLDGRSLAERIVADRPGIKVLFMSGYTERVAPSVSRFAREPALLEKPFTSRKLALMVSHTLRAR